MMRPSLPRVTVLPALAVLLVSGCGGSDPVAESTPDNITSGDFAAPGGGAGRDRPAAAGVIAAVSGRTLQLQDSSSQTAVTYSATTKFTRSVAATLAVGDCVTVTGTPGAGGVLTATSVRVLSAGGECAAETGFPPERVGTSRARPSGAPDGASPPSGGPPTEARPPGAPGGGQSPAVAFGTVKSVSGSTAVLSGTLRTGGRLEDAATPGSTPTASPITVTLDSSATITRTVAATSADAKVGVCATATGKADSTGAVAAAAVALSPKGADGCRTGIRRGPVGGTGG